VFNHYKIEAKIIKAKNPQSPAKVPVIFKNHLCPKSPIVSPKISNKVPESQTLELRKFTNPRAEYLVHPVWWVKLKYFSQALI
jgi:hypothetical protein